MCDQEVKSCDCVDEETECSDGEERIRHVLSVAGNTSEQFAIGVITDTGESCRTLSSVTQFYGENSKNLKLDKFPPAFTAATLYTVDRRIRYTHILWDAW